MNSTQMKLRANAIINMTKQRLPGQLLLIPGSYQTN